MKRDLFILPGVVGQEVILPRALCPVHQWEGCLSTTHSRQKMREYLATPPTVTGLFVRGVEVEGVRKAKVAATHDTRSSGRRQKKKDGFSSKIQIPEFGGKKGHPNDVADTFRQWARCITYYCDFYDDSYLMPLVVSSLKGETSDVFDWTQSVTPGRLKISPHSYRCSVSTIVALIPSGSRETWLRTFVKESTRMPQIL